MHRTIGVIAGLLIGICSTAAYAQDSWVNRGVGVQQFSSEGSGVAGGSIYFFGGVGSTAAWSYNPILNLWTNVADLPAPRASMGCASIGNIIYCIGGIDENGNVTSSVFAYDTTQDTWSTLADLSTARGELSCAVANGTIYAIGGRDVNSNILATVEAYDPALDTWTAAPDLAIPISRAFAGTIGITVYVAGGVTTGDLLSRTTQLLAGANWIPRAPLPTAKSGGASVILAGRFFCLGGLDENGIATTNFEYEPAGDRWTARAPLIADLVDGSGQVIAGTAVVVADRVQIYTAPIYNATPEVPASLCQSPMTFTVGADRPVIAAGSVVNFATFQFAAELYDADGDEVRLEVEVRLLSDSYTGDASVVSDWGIQATHTTGDITLAPGSYKWQARTADRRGLVSDWVQFGNGVMPDFTYDPNVAVTNPGVAPALSPTRPQLGGAVDAGGSGAGKAGCGMSVIGGHDGAVAGLLILIGLLAVRRR